MEQSRASVEATTDEEDDAEAEVTSPTAEESDEKTEQTEISRLVTKVLVGLDTGCTFKCISIMRMIYGSTAKSNHSAYPTVRGLLHDLATKKTELPNRCFIGKDDKGFYQVYAA